MEQLIFELYFENTNIYCINLLANKIHSSINALVDFDCIIDGLDFKILTTPQRLTILIESSQTITYLKKGVKITDSDKYLQYFMDKIGVKNKNELFTIDDRYYFKQIINVQNIFDKFTNEINVILQNSFINTYNHKNILLNLKSIFYIINNTIQKIDFNNIKSNNVIYLNQNNKKEIASIKEYFATLENKGIYFDEQMRKTNLINNFKNTSASNINEFINNVLLISEVPTFSCSKIQFTCDELFLKILQKILKDRYILSIQDKYLYFTYLNNNETNDSIHKAKVEKSIVKANNLIELNNKQYTKNNKEYKYIFNENRLTRLNKITKLISLWVPNSNIAEINNILSCFVYKNSNLLSDNTELSLLIKQYIMLQRNRDINFVNIVVDSFKPFNKKNDFPIIPTSVAIAIASKVDNIVYYSVLKELKVNFNKQKEKDNYTDLLNIILYNNIDLPIKLVFDFSLKNFINETISKKKNRTLIKKYKINKNVIVNNIVELFYDKLYFYILNNDNCKGSVLNYLMTGEINAISNSKNRCNIMKLYHKIKSICRYFENTTRSIDYVATSYKRINNLLLGNKINLMKIVPIVLQPKKFSNKEEENLYRSYFALKKDIKLLTSKNDYTSIMDGLFDLSRSVNEFLSKNYVNKVGVFKKNRYVKLLFACKNLYNKVIRFDDGV